MEKQLFRKKSMERVSSPEQMHDYLRVTSPRLWMILGAIVIMLSGFIVYASTATMENTMKVQLNVKKFTYEDLEDKTVDTTFVDGRIPISQKGVLALGMPVRLGAAKGVISFLYEEEDDIRFFVDMEKKVLMLPDGTYDGEVVVESTTPISFLWN